MGKSSSKLRQDGTLSPQLSRRKTKRKDEGKLGKTFSADGKKADSKIQNGSASSCVSDGTLNNKAVIERRRVLNRKPFQSLMQDGAEGLYIWFLTTWMRIRQKHFNSMDEATEGSNDSLDMKKWRQSTVSDATSVFDLEQFSEEESDDLTHDVTMNLEEKIVTCSTIIDRTECA